MGYHNLLSKCDQALVAYLISAGAGTSADIFAAKRAGDLPNPPFTGVISESGVEEVPFSGVYKVKAAIEIHTNAAPDVDEDTAQMRVDSDTRVQNTFDAMHDFYSGSGDALGVLITAAATAAGIANFTVQSVEIRNVEQDRGEKEGEWIDTMNIEVLCRTS